MGTSLSPTALRCNNITDPLGVSDTSPRLSWQLETDNPNQRGQGQSAYQIMVATQPANLLALDADCWDSSSIAAATSIHIPYAGVPLHSGQRYWWMVRVWDAAGDASSWSAPAWWEMGLLRQQEWQAQFIGITQRLLATDLPITLPDPLFPAAPLTLPAIPCLRKRFTTVRPVAQARIYATACGVYELHLNGQRIHDTFLAPGWTDYRQRLLYQTYDVTEHIVQGDNVLGALVGDGWYSGYVGYTGQRDHYGDTPQLLAQMHLTYADDTTEVISSDASWRGATGPLLAADLLHGEHVDARRWWRGWDQPGFDDSAWQEVASLPLTALPQIVADTAQPIRVTQEVAPQAMAQRQPGTWIVDFGQNLVGWVRLWVRGEAGQRVILRFAEMVDADGNLYRANLRSASATDSYILQGGDAECFVPRFTFHGFRYCEVIGYPGELIAEAITACVIESDTPSAGTLTSSHDLVSQLHQNIVWGQRGNFLSVPTDCPQRDERLGWLGDAQIFARSATYNRDVAAFFARWLDTVADAQGVNGAFSDVAPRLVVVSDGAPAWGDAGVLIPWTLYQVYGDRQILERHWEAMERWLRYVEKGNPDGIWQHRRNLDYGDWLTVVDATPKDVVATAFYAQSAQVMACIATVLGREAAIAHYTALFHHICTAFIHAYVTDDGRVAGETQTAYALALQLDLLPLSLRTAAAQHLVMQIEQQAYHITTGFLGIRYLLPALTEAGYTDVAYQLLLQETYPSWGYCIRQGATTIWERWDGWTEAGGFQDPAMNSFNHYSLGSVDEWLFRYAAGIELAAPGYQHIRIQPHPHPALGHLEATYHSVAGPIRCAWSYTADGLRVQIDVPVNTAAHVTLPVAATQQVWESDRPIEAAEGVRMQGRDAETHSFQMGSGHYVFMIKDVAP